jgi:hypothetical protein
MAFGMAATIEMRHPEIKWMRTASFENKCAFSPVH